MVIDINAAQSSSYLSNEYLIQSVANLGQRLGVKGDSIATNSFTFKSLFSESSLDTNISSSTHIGKIERRYGSMFLSIVPRSTLKRATDEADLIEHYIMNSGNVYVSQAAIENPSSSINNVEFYTYPVIAIRSSEFVFAGIGCVKDANDKTKEVEFIYEEFDKETGKISNALRLRNVGGYNLVVTASYTSNKVWINTYQLSGGADDLSNHFADARELLNNMNGVSKSGNNIGVSNEAKINEMSIDFWLKIFKWSKYSAANLKDYILKDNAAIESININDLSGEYDKVKMMKYSGLADVLGWLKYDEGDLFSNIKEIYSQSLYASSNIGFKEQILCAIFNAIYDKYPMSAVAYVPIDFSFNYYCNSNDPWKIYGGVNGLNVRFVNVTITPKNLKSYYANDQILANIASDNKSSIYNYDVEYDKNNPNIVYKVNVSKQYSLPYINSDNYWVINDQLTNIQANGKDAGNPNIIFVYNYNKIDDGGFEILSGGNLEMLKSNLVSWKNKIAFIEPIDKINVDDPQIVSKSDLIKVSCKVPNIESADEATKKKILPFLQYALIVNISSVQCFDKISKETLIKYGEYGVVTTFWRFDEKTEDFVVVENPMFSENVDNVALDITSMTNLNNLVKWHIQNTEYKHPDRYSHKWLVFDNANIELKNNVSDYRTYIYPVMMNKSAVDFSLTNYANDLNFYVKYNDAISGAEDEHITTVSQTNSRFLTSNNVQTTNSLYYTKNGLYTKNYEEYVPNQNMPTLNLSEVFAKDVNIVNRTNMISFDKSGNMHYSYIGTSFDDSDKTTVHIGGAKSNINIGNETLVKNDNRNLFFAPKKLAIDIDNTTMNGFAYVKKDLEVSHDVNVLHLNWTVCRNEFNVVYKTNYIPESRFVFSVNPGDKALDYVSPLQFNNNSLVKFGNNPYDEIMINGQMMRYYRMASTYPSTSTNINNYRLWVPSFYVMPTKRNGIKGIYNEWVKMIYCGEALYVPGLLCKLGLGDWCKKLSKVTLKSNMEIVKYNSTPIFLMTSNMFITEIDYTSVSVEDAFIGWKYNEQDIYTGKSLDISYYIGDSTNLILTVNEATNSQKVKNLFAFKLDY